MAEIHIQHINRHRETETGVIILIVHVVLIEVNLTIVIIPITASNTTGFLTELIRLTAVIAITAIRIGLHFSLA